MKRISFLCLVVMTAICQAVATEGAGAQVLQALARLEVAGSEVTGRLSGDVDIRLKLTRAVPYRAFTLAEPARLVLDFREVNFNGVTARDIVSTELVTGLRYGIFRPGWSRMVMTLKRPMRLHVAVMATGDPAGGAQLSLRLTPGTPLGEIAGQTGDIWALPTPAEAPVAKTRPLGDRKIVVALDPGHGGIDPGAQYYGESEANLVLKLAREMKEDLVRTGRYKVVMTRNEDVFLSLQGRVSLARAQGADIFLSLHADALAKGTATGTTVYTLSDSASNKAAAALAAAHDRGDLLAGVDLAEQDDLIASVLMDMARVETGPRSEKLADALVAGIAQAVGRIRARPRLSAGFSVLKAPDIPSVLIEFGFISNKSDLANLNRAEWRTKVIAGIIRALDDWSLADAAEARLLRR